MIHGLRNRRILPGLWLGLAAWLFVSCTLDAAKPARSASSPGSQAPSAAVAQSLKRAQAKNFLQRAKNAAMAGNAAEAERFWMQASSLDPFLQRPGWLDQRPAGVTPVETVLPVEALLAKAAALEYRDAAPLLEDWLRRFPEDTRVRAYYLERAKAARDAVQTKRHQSLLQPEPPKASAPWWKYLVAVLFGALLVRETVVFIREWRNGKS